MCFQQNQNRLHNSKPLKYKMWVSKDLQQILWCLIDIFTVSLHHGTLPGGRTSATSMGLGLPSEWLSKVFDLHWVSSLSDEVEGWQISFCCNFTANRLIYPGQVLRKTRTSNMIRRAVTSTPTHSIQTGQWLAEVIIIKHLCAKTTRPVSFATTQTINKGRLPYRILNIFFEFITDDQWEINVFVLASHWQKSSIKVFVLKQFQIRNRPDRIR